jgi:hypothetical protein
VYPPVIGLAKEIREFLALAVPRAARVREKNRKPVCVSPTNGNEAGKATQLVGSTRAAHP